MIQESSMPSTSSKLTDTKPVNDTKKKNSTDAATAAAKDLGSCEETDEMLSESSELINTERSVPE